MFRKDDYVNYSVYGICKIEDIRFMKFSASPAEREYYVLRPVHQENTSIFVPKENQKLIARMRPILSPEEIDRIILSVKDRKMAWIGDYKKRTAQFHTILSRRDERELLLLAGCLYGKSREGAKGLAPGEAQVLKKVENMIGQEFSFSLKISKDKVGEYIRKKLEIAG